MGRSRSSAQPEPPDSGWAWVVLVGSFMVNFMAIGFLASVSVYVHVWIDYFDGSAAETSLVISLCSFMMGFFSPVSGVFCTWFGPRLTVMIGATIMTGGMFVSSYSTGVLFLVLSLGLVTALGMSMCVNGMFSGLAMYFRRRLALAISICTAGTSVGQIVFPPLYQYLIDLYGWRGSLLIVSALSFHVVISGVLIRRVQHGKTKEKKKKKKNKNGEKEEEEKEEKGNEEKPPGSPSGAREARLTAPSTEQKEGGWHAEGGSSALVISALSPSVFARDNYLLSQHVGLSVGGTGSLHGTKADHAEDLFDDHEDDIIRYVDSDTWSARSMDEVTAANTVWAPFAVAPVGTPRAGRRRGRGQSVAPITRHRASSMISQSLVKQTSDLPRLARNASFDVLLLVALAHGFGWASTTYHLVSRAESVGIAAEEAALLLTLMGVGSLVGRLIIGWLLDRGLIRPEIGYSISFAVCAVATLVMPLVTIYGVLVALALVHGVSSGASTVVVMAGSRLFVKPSLSTSATSFVLFAWGAGEISGGVLAGWYYDALDSYDYSFYTAGSLMMAGCGLMMVIYFLQQAKKRRHGVRVPDPRPAADLPGDPSSLAELGRSASEDMGKVNPMYFMRERLDSEGEGDRRERAPSEDGGESQGESRFGDSVHGGGGEEEIFEGSVDVRLPPDAESVDGPAADGQMYGGGALGSSPHLSHSRAADQAEFPRPDSRDGQEALGGLSGPDDETGEDLEESASLAGSERPGSPDVPGSPKQPRDADGDERVGFSDDLGRQSVPPSTSTSTSSSSGGHHGITNPVFFVRSIAPKCSSTTTANATTANATTTSEVDSDSECDEPPKGDAGSGSGRGDDAVADAAEAPPEAPASPGRVLGHCPSPMVRLWRAHHRGGSPRRARAEGELGTLGKREVGIANPCYTPSPKPARRVRGRLHGDGEAESFEDGVTNPVYEEEMDSSDGGEETSL